MDCAPTSGTALSLDTNEWDNGEATRMATWLTTIGVVLTLLSSSSCGDATALPEVSLMGMDPAEGLEGERIAVQVAGAGFHIQVRTRLDEGTVSGDVAVLTLAGVVLEELVHQSEGLIEAVVPATVPSGQHELNISFKDGRTATLPLAFTVHADVPPGGGTLVADDPFGDGTDFTYVAAYGGQVYLGPSADGSTLVRMDPDGTGAETVALNFSRDATGNVSRNTAATAPPYTSIGANGCASGTLECGPDDEDGRGLLAAGSYLGGDWLVLGGARSGGDLDYIYMTSTTTAPLDFQYVDISAGLGGQTRGFSALHIVGDRIYMGFPDTGGQRPYLVTLLTAPSGPGLDATAGTDLIELEADDIGAMKTAGMAMIDSITDFNSRIYLANSGDWVRSTTEFPLPADTNPGDWTSHLPSAAAYGAKSSVTTSKTAELDPSDKAVSQMAVFNGRLYFARNTSDGPQLWVCNPGSVGDALECDSDDWSLIVANTTGDAQLSQFDNANNTALTLLVATPQYLYVGFDNANSGAVVFRSSASAPTVAADFVGEDGCAANLHPATCNGLLGNGLGDPQNTRIFFGAALTFDTSVSVYVSSGALGDGVQVYRLQ